jgi:hypothetical protein
VWWVLLAVVLGVVGLVVLGLFTLRLWRQVRQFGRDVAAAGDRIARASDELQRAAPPASRH